MMRDMSYPLLLQWIAYDRLDPIGEARADLRTGIIASTIANVHRSQGKAPYKPVDFIPKFESQEQTPAEMVALAKRAMLASDAMHRKKK